MFYDIKGEEKKNVYILLFCLINHKRQNEKKRHMPMKNACSDDDNCTVPNRTFILFLTKK